MWGSLISMSKGSSVAGESREMMATSTCVVLSGILKKAREDLRKGRDIVAHWGISLD